MFDGQQMQTIKTNPLVSSVATPPIADVAGWIEGRAFPSDFPLLDVSQAVPSYPPADALRHHMAERLNEPATSIYTDIPGLGALRESLARHLSDEYQGNVTPSQVGVTAGCNQAFCIAMDTLAGPGDEVVMPLPYFFNHQMWLAMRGMVPAHPPFEEGLPRVESIADAITDRTRAIAIVSPSNPTGVEYPPALFSSLYELARERSIALVIDETYKDFRSNEGPPHQLFQHPDWESSFVHLFSFSKSYAMTGYRVGGMVAAPGFIDEATKMLDCMTICPSHIGQLGALYALENLAGWRDEKVLLMRARVKALQEGFRSNRLGYQLISAGACFAYIRHPFGDEGATSVARRLADEQNVLCLPGNMFGPGQEGYLRFAFANLETDEIPELIERLIRSQ